MFGFPQTNPILKMVLLKGKNLNNLIIFMTVSRNNNNWKVRLVCVCFFFCFFFVVVLFFCYASVFLFFFLFFFQINEQEYFGKGHKYSEGQKNGSSTATLFEQNS